MDACGSSNADSASAGEAVLLAAYPSRLMRGRRPLTSRMLLSGGITAYGTLGRAYPVHLIDRTGGLPPGSPVVSPKRLASRLPPRRSDRGENDLLPQRRVVRPSNDA